MYIHFTVTAVNMDPTLLHTSVTQQTGTLIYHAIAIYMLSNKYAPHMPHIAIWPNYNMPLRRMYANKYTTYEVALINYIARITVCR